MNPEPRLRAPRLRARQRRPARHVIQHVNIEIVCHALDLALPPATLLAQVAGIAGELVAPSHAA